MPLLIEGGFTASGPDKKKLKELVEHIDRTGIPNLGEEADKALGVRLRIAFQSHAGMSRILILIAWTIR